MTNISEKTSKLKKILGNLYGLRTYNLEGTKVSGNRLISLLILISIAYTVSTFTG
jgi:hypothetical protein